MSTEVPLKIRMDIRDLWDAKSSAVEEAIDSLAKTLGYKVVPRVEWSQLWGTLKDRYPDKAAFIPTISRIMVAWCDVLQRRLEDETHSTWIENILETLSHASHNNTLVLIIESSPSKNSRPSTQWKTISKSFYLYIPNADAPSSTGIQKGFDMDFEAIFAAPGSTSLQEEDGWADVMEETRTVARNPPISAPAATPQLPSTERLPVINAMSRPPELFSSTAPYILIIQHRGNQIWVQCSHEQSLELLSSYLKKWGRSNPNDSLKRQILTVQLTESDFCAGIYDSLTIETTMSHLRNVSLNPAVVLAFVEGILGYKMVYTNGTYWMYRSERLLK